MRKSDVRDPTACVRVCWEARRVGDRDLLLSVLCPEVQLVGPRGEIARGCDRVADLWLARTRFDHLDLEVSLAAAERLAPLRALAIVRQVYRWRETGAVGYETQSGALYDVRDGRILRVRLFPAVADARAAGRD